MKKIVYTSLAAIVSLILMAGQAWAPPPGGEPPGNLAEKIAALEAAVATLQGQVETLENDATALQARVVQLETLTAYMEVVEGEIADLAGPHVIFEGVNVHVRSGSGQTDDDGSLTGLGNLIIGYNEEPSTDVPYYKDQGGPPPFYRGGSHNLVVGTKHSYSSYGCFLAGGGNKAGYDMASVSGGSWNQATGLFSSVSGGKENQSTGSSSSVSGGHDNIAAGGYSTVSGSHGLTAAYEEHLPCCSGSSP